MNRSQDALSFASLREANANRCLRWHDTPAKQWNVMEWGCAMAGEAGEACNVAKKIRRLDQGLITKDYDRSKLLAALAEECADTLIYLDLLCHQEGINLEAAVRKKFNEVSAFYKFPEVL